MRRFKGFLVLKLLDQLEEEGGGGGETINTNNVTVLLDLAFANNVRFLDEHEMYLTDQVELSKTLPFACGMAMARGISDSLMSAAYFNGSALRFLRSVLPSPRRSPPLPRQWVTGGATVELEKSLAEGAGLRGGYSTPQLERWGGLGMIETSAASRARDRIRVEEIVLRDSPWSRYAEWGARWTGLLPRLSL